jgi:hypothetical protein
MPTISLPTRYAIELLHAQSIVIYTRNLLFVHRARVVALTAVVTTVFRFAQRVTHITGYRNLTASTDDTPYLASRAPLRQHMWQNLTPVN